MSSANPPTSSTSVPWFFSEDTSFQINNTLKEVVYHPSLNVLLVFTHDNQILVLDASSGSIYKRIGFVGSSESLKCCYLGSMERLVTACGGILSTRKDHNGVLMLDNLLQQQVESADDDVTAVLPLNDALHLLEASTCSDSSGLEHVAEILKELEEKVMPLKETVRSSHKEAKWATVCLKRPQGMLHKALMSILLDIKRIRTELPGFSVASGLADQVSLFSTTSELLNPTDATGVVDKSLMHNECVRRSTFKDWPHLNYKWALPVPMAQAGFYYHPNTSGSNGDDRAMCFVCNVCLIYWEATDEPWSEHERHSPHCPFVKGEYTQNVPISATHATEPAKLHSSKEKITHVGSTTSNRFFATIHSESQVVVWDTNTFLKEHVVVHLNPTDPIISSAFKAEFNKTSTNGSQDSKDNEHFQDCSVNIGSACIINQPSEISTEIAKHGNYKDFLIVGVGLRFHDRTKAASGPTGIEGGESKKPTDVMVLNRLNQEKNVEPSFCSGDVAVVTDGGDSSCGGLSESQSPESDRLCLVVYDISPETSRDASKQPNSSVSSTMKSKQPSIVQSKKIIGKSYTPLQDCMADIEMVDDIMDDQDLQIVGFTPPQTSSLDHMVGPMKPKIILTSNSGHVAKFEQPATSNSHQSPQESTSKRSISCIPLPPSIRSSKKLTIKQILPSQDGTRILVVVGTASEVAAGRSDESADWTLVYKVNHHKPGPLLVTTPVAQRQHKETITSVCLLPSDACQPLMYDEEDSSSEDNMLLVNMQKGEASKSQSSVKKLTDEDASKWESVDSDLHDDLSLSMNKMFGTIVMLSSEGDITLFSMMDLSVMATLKCLEGTAADQRDPFISVTYCSGIDRICLATQSNLLKFFSLKPTVRRSFPTLDGSPCMGESLFDVVNFSQDPPKSADHISMDQPSSLMAQKKLTPGVLTGLRRLIYYKNLTPRFVSTVPPYWKEVVQEQQQRKHPQHLHHHGEGVQHTRTWKLQTDSTVVNEENLFELVLPMPTIVGHVLLKFSLDRSVHHSSPSPQIRATLLRPNLGSKPGESCDLDRNVDFGLTREDRRDASYSKEQYNESLEKRYRAKVIYGPVDLCDHLDLSGTQGIIPMTSRLLMRDWSKTLLLHFKVINFPSKCEPQSAFASAPPPPPPPQLQQQSSKKQENTKMNEKQWYTVVTSKPPPGPSSSNVLGQSSKFRVSDLSASAQSNTMIQEISITIRKCRKFGGCHKDQSSKLSLSLSSLENRMTHLRRLDRSYMLENPSFHDRLLEIVAGREKAASLVGSTKSVKLHLALDILIWIIDVTRDDCSGVVDSGQKKVDILRRLQGCLTDVIRTCLLCSDRSLAHKCARMFAACFINCNHSAQLGDGSSSLQFQTALLSSLTSCLPLIATTFSAGSIHWFFVVFNHIKHLDPSLSSRCCGELLTRVAEEYGQRNDDLHSFLRTRLGLIGSPLDPELFDVDPSLPSVSQANQAKTQLQHHSTVPPANANSYSGVVMGQSSYLYGTFLGGAPVTSGSLAMQGNAPSSNASTFPDEGMFKDLMYLLDLERNFGTSGSDKTLKCDQNARFVAGLLESEPLHFTCHSASDGTRMEELDAAQQSMAPANMQPAVGPNDSLGGPFNFTPDMASMMVMDAATGSQMNLKGSHFGSLSSGMMATVDDNQLQQLHNKQMMLLKLQMQKKKLEQKLAETTKAMAAGTSKQSSTSVVSSLLNSDLLPPPAPKNTPFFMTPPLTPNEIYPNLFSSITLPESQADSGKSSDGAKIEGSNEDCSNESSSQKLSVSWQQTKNVFQTPTPYALIIDRVHSGARRFVVLDFGKPICLTDVMIPSCSDVASMSIDVWLNSERADGQRLVETNDIWTSNLIMCDILPPPICRYLKITTIRRYGGNTGRSKIPIGSFYGHSFIVPWQRVSDVSLTSMLSSTSNLNLAQHSEATMTPHERNQGIAQLNIYMSLLEDIHCSYGIARSRLSLLVSNLMQTEKNDQASKLMLLPKGKYSATEGRVVQAYQKTMQLQVQLNTAKRAIYRLQQELGLSTQQSAVDLSFDLMDPGRIRQVLVSLNTDTLRFLAEQLSGALLGLTANASISSTPFVDGLQHAYMLFSSLCTMNHSRKLQTTVGVLLARICGDLPWWGDFFGRIFLEFFSADQKHIFPQDRLFVLMVYLGQKSLCGTSAGAVLESILSLLSKLLLPLVQDKKSGDGDSSPSRIENLDLTLISWMLLFVSKSLDNVSSATYLDEGEKQSSASGNSKAKDGSKWPGNTPYLNSRWNFLQAEDVLSHSAASNGAQSGGKPLKVGSSLKCSNRRRIYARIVQQKLNCPMKLIHQKKHLWKNDIISSYQPGKVSNGVTTESMKKAKLSYIFKTMLSVKGAKVVPSKSSFSLVDSEDEVSNANAASDYSSCTNSKLSSKMSSFKKMTGKKDGSSGGGAVVVDGWDLQEWDPMSLVSRATCLTLVRGLYNLILSLDLTCHVDLFIITCKVLTRTMTSCRPTIQLSEVMTMQDLEKLLALACGGYYGGQKLWGGSWTLHIIICFLQDILEVERLVQPSMDSNNSNYHRSQSDSSPLMYSSPLSAIQCDDSDDDDDDDDDAALGNNSTVPDLMADCKFDEEMSMLVDALVHDEEMSSPMKTGSDDASGKEQSDDSGKQDWLDVKSLYEANECMNSYGFWNYLSDKEAKLSDIEWKDMDSFDPADSLDSSSTWKFASPMVQQSMSADQQQMLSNTSNSNKFSNNNNASNSFNKATFQSKLPIPFLNNPLTMNKIAPSPIMFQQQVPFKSVPPPDCFAPHGISLAMDSRLEQGLELSAELRLKTMLAAESNIMQGSLLQPLNFASTEGKKNNNLRNGQAAGVAIPSQVCSSADMLSASFSKLLKDLSSSSISLENLLDVWVSLNESPTFDVPNGHPVPIDDAAVGSLLQFVSQSAYLNGRTWSLLFKCLTVVETYRDYFSRNFNSDNACSDLFLDPNFSIILQKFLSGSMRPHYPNTIDYKAGPPLVKDFHDFISSPALGRSRQKGELQDTLLSIVAAFSKQGGAFYSCNGPIDVQTTMVNDLADMVDSIRAEPVRVSDDAMTSSDERGGRVRESGCLDLHVCLQVVANVSALALIHMTSAEPTLCQNSSDPFVINPRVCFTGVSGQTLKSVDGKHPNLMSCGNSPRDSLILSLLKLVDQLIRLPLPPTYPSTDTNKRSSEVQVETDRGDSDPSPLGATNVKNDSGIASPPLVGADDAGEEQGITDEQKSANILASTQQGYSPFASVAKNLLPETEGFSPPANQSCSHRNFFDLVGAGKELESCRAFPRSKMVADVVLGRLDVMFNLYSSLCLCSHDALELMKNNETYNGESPLSVGDGVFKILCTLNSKATGVELVVESLFKFLASSGQHLSPLLPPSQTLSEPLLIYAFKVLDCAPALAAFTGLGGVEMVCNNLVKSNEKVISAEPSLISTIMNYFGSCKIPSLNNLKLMSDRGSEGLHNFAPIGTISSSNQATSPPNVLIQNTPPPRRARSAAWSYHFFPEEKWIDLTITLPFAVLLKEVVVVPHFNSLDTCPGAVILESSRNGFTPPLPLCSPICTSGLTNIRIKLPSPKITTSVTIHLHRPRDSAILGLTQIMVMGTFALGPDTKLTPESMKSYAIRNAEDNVLKTNLEWLRLFHHCVMKSDNVSRARVILSAASIPDFLRVCVSLFLVSHLPDAERILLFVGRHTIETGLQLIEILLGGHGATFEYCDEKKDQNLEVNAKNSGIECELYTSILYNLCTFQDGMSMSRIVALVEWLTNCAKTAINKRRALSEGSERLQSPRLAVSGPSVGNVQCVAAVLWNMKRKCDLKTVVGKKFLRLMFDWSCTCSTNNSLKAAIDSVVCSACHVRSDLFPVLVEWMDLFSRGTSDRDSFFSDDAPVTDDIKADHRDTSIRGQPSLVGGLSLTPWKLYTLCTVSRAPKSIRHLERIGFFSSVCQLLYDFFSSDVAAKFLPSTPGHNGLETNPPTSHDQGISVELVSRILEFLSDICLEDFVKDLLNESQNSAFWSPLLKSLCSRFTANSVFENMPLHKWTLPMLESSAIKLITNLVSCHSNNQHLFSCALLDTIRSSAVLTSAFSSPLPGFLRYLLLQVVLEDEKVVVYIHSNTLFMTKESSSHNLLLHPQFGAGHYHRTVLVSLQLTLAEVVAMISDFGVVSAAQLSGSEPSKDHKTVEAKKSTTPKSTSTQPQKKTGTEKLPTPVAQADPSTLVVLHHPLMPDHPLPGDMTLSQLRAMLRERGISQRSSLVELDLVQWKSCANQKHKDSEMRPTEDLETPQDSSLLQVFSGVGGLALLAERLPLLCPEFIRQTSSLTTATKNHQWSPVKVIQSGFIPVDWSASDGNDQIYEDPYEPPLSPLVSHSKPPAQASPLQLQNNPSIPPHSLIAFGIFLRLPGYSEVLLKERKKAQYLLRLVLGMTDDGNGGLILNSPVAGSLPSLPFQVLKHLLDSSPLTTDDGMLLRRTCVNVGVVHLILACLSILGHHAPRQHISGIYQEILKVASQSQLYMSASPATAVSSSSSSSGTASNAQAKAAGEEKGHNYWAKGTGFGTGSTASSWDAEHALVRQKSEEEHVTCLLQVLASFINPRRRDDLPGKKSGDDVDGSADAGPSFSGSRNDGALPSCLPLLLSQSCLLPALSSYLRNDSVLDMACHIPLYRALLELLQAIATCPSLVALLLPLPEDEGESSSAISVLLDKMKKCVDTYANRLKGNKGQRSEAADDESEGLAPLIREIQDTSAIVNHAIVECLSAAGASASKDKKKEDPSCSLLPSSSTAREDGQSADDKYVSIMKLLQYDTFKMVFEERGCIKFAAPHHYEANIRAAGEVNNSLRARRLAQEAVTLSTSLPLSADGSVFVRCDEDRLDVMKVLMTGPTGTPYSQGCFEFDVFFPTDYPNSPPLINLQTTGNHSIRFNPNLYNDGKVCLSIINTWHGRPEEKWNSQTSSFLQVLVSVQSLILVNEPYFNEPGYERSRGTPSGMASSREYDSNIRQATVKWSMLEMVKNPPPAFKQIIQWHFWMKRNEILAQVEEWIADMETHTKDKRVGRNISQNLLSLKRHYSQLKEEFSKLTAPESIDACQEEEDQDDDDDEEEDDGISFVATSGTDAHVS